MDILDLLVADHENLRRLMAAMTNHLGDQRSTGPNDIVELDRFGLAEANARLVSAFITHERLEDRCLLSAIRALEASGGLSAHDISEDHQTLRQLFQLLTAVERTCDGRHVHALREVLERVERALEKHLEYEEEILFPSIRKNLPPDTLMSLGRTAEDLLQRA